MPCLNREFPREELKNVIARLLGCAGQASDAVSAFTHGKMADAPALLRLPKSERRDIYGYVYHVTNVPKHGKVWKNQCFHWKGICADTGGRDSSNRFYLEMPGRKHRPGNVSSCSVSRVFSCPCTMRTEICSNDFWLSNLLCIRIRILSSRKLFLFFLNLLRFRNSFTHHAACYIYTCVVASVHTLC